MTHYVGYKVLGIEALERSDFRYCQYGEFRPATGHDSSLMRLLSIASLYPVKVEMLMKSGLAGLVKDLVIRGKKNAAIFDWDGDSIKTAFKLNKAELREWKASGGDTYTAETYLRMKKRGERVSIGDVLHIRGELGYRFSELLSLCKTHKLSAVKTFRYLEKFTGPRCGGMGVFSAGNAFQTWSDYLMLATKLGWELGEETVLLPKNLEGRHNEAVQENQLREDRLRADRDAKRAQELDDMRKLNAESLEKRRAKYNVEAEGYFIRIAESAEEILHEGRTLCHCVGGYAERHLKGSITILFMRRTETPEASLYTIEMQGNTMVQIHGYKNERIVPAPEPPKEKMAWLLEPWLDWLRRGSPRDEQGKAKLKLKNIIKEAKSA